MVLSFTAPPDRRNEASAPSTPPLKLDPATSHNKVLLLIPSGVINRKPVSATTVPLMLTSIMGSSSSIVVLLTVVVVPPMVTSPKTCKVPWHTVLPVTVKSEKAAIPPNTGTLAKAASTLLFSIRAILFLDGIKHR